MPGVRRGRITAARLAVLGRRPSVRLVAGPRAGRAAAQLGRLRRDRPTSAGATRRATPSEGCRALMTDGRRRPPPRSAPAWVPTSRRRRPPRRRSTDPAAAVTITPRTRAPRRHHAGRAGRGAASRREGPTPHATRTAPRFSRRPGVAASCGGGYGRASFRSRRTQARSVPRRPCSRPRFPMTRRNMRQRRPEGARRIGHDAAQPRPAAGR